MSFPVKLEVISSKDVKSKKRWRKIQWDGEQSENISLLGSRTLAQFNLVTGKKRRVDASIKRILGKVVHITGSTSGTCVVGMLQDGHLFRWRKNTRTITNILPCPGFNPAASAAPGVTPNQVFRKPKLFINDDGSTILLFSRHSGVYMWRGIGFPDSGWSKITIGNAAASLLSSKGVTLDTVFYIDKVAGQIMKCAFVSDTGDSLSVGILTLHPSHPATPPSYILSKYPYLDFSRPCIPTRLRETLLPCWSRNGRVLAVAVNQRQPSLARVLLIQPESGGVVNVGFEKVLQNAVEMSFWISSLSWTHDHLFLACATKQGAVLLVSTNGTIMQVIAKSPVEKFGPGVFLPLEGVVGFRRPAQESKPREIDESTDTSMQSTVLPPRLRKPYYTVCAHPSLPILLCGDGYSIAAVKIIDAINSKDIVTIGIGETVQRIVRITKTSQLQMTILEPLSYFVMPESEEYDTDREQHWRESIKAARERLLQDTSMAREADVSKENSPEQQALLSFLIEDLDDSRLAQSGSRHERSINGSVLEDATAHLLHDIINCHGNLLSLLMLLSLSPEEGNHPANDHTTEATQIRFSNTELATVYAMTFKLFCDVLLQIQDIADIYPSEMLSESFLSKNGDQPSLQGVASSVIASLGHGVLSLLAWNDFSQPADSVFHAAVEEIVGTMLMNSRKSSEGCLSGEDVLENLQRAFLFLVKSETCISKQMRCYSLSIFLDPTMPRPSKIKTADDGDAVDTNEIEIQPCCNRKLYFASAWQTLSDYVAKLQSTGSHFQKESTVLPQIASYLQSRTFDQIVMLREYLDSEEIAATKVLLRVCKGLCAYDFCSAMSYAFGNLHWLISNMKKWTDERWLPIEILGSVIASYFCGSPVTVPSLMGALSKNEGDSLSDGCYVSLQQEKITANIRAQSLGESWNLDSAILLLLSSGRVKEAAGIASDVGDWRTAFVLSALYEKTNFSATRLEKGITGFKSSNIESLLKNRFQDVISSIFGVKVELAEDLKFSFSEYPRNFAEIDSSPYSKCLKDLYEISAMVGIDITTWTTSTLLNTIKSSCTHDVPLLVPNAFNLPHPQLYLPQFSAHILTEDVETKLRNKLSAYSRLLLTIQNSIGIQRVLALWYLKFLDREAVCGDAHHNSCCERKKLPSSLAERSLLKDVTIQGLELKLEHLHANATGDGVYLLAAVFRELCSILWLFHVRDKLSASVRKYQDIRERFVTSSGADGSADSKQNEIYVAVQDCLYWVRKVLPFARFMHFEPELEELVLCLIAELPLNRTTATLLAEFFHQEKVAPKNKHRLQVIIEKMRKVQVTDDTEDMKPLSAFFNEECRKLSQHSKVMYSGHFSMPKSQITSKSTGEMSQTDTLSREEPSVISKVTPENLLETLEICYAFEADELYHKYVFEFVEIALSKSPATATFTPKKERKSHRTSRPLHYPLVLAYRNEIARSELEMIVPRDEEKSTLLTMVVPIPERTDSSIASGDRSDDTVLGHRVGVVQHKNSQSSPILNWDFFKPSEFGFGNNENLTKFILQVREIRRIDFEELSVSFKKRLQRLVPYFAWLEHWRSQLVPMPQNVSLDKQRKPAMRIAISTEHLIHGFTMAELRFGKNVRIKEGKKEMTRKLSETSGVSSLQSEEIISTTVHSEVPSQPLREEPVPASETVPKTTGEPDLESTRIKEPSQQALGTVKDDDKTLEPSELHSDAQKIEAEQSPGRELHATTDDKPEDTQTQDTEAALEGTGETQKKPSVEVEDLSHVPEPSSGNLLRKILHKDDAKESQSQGIDAMSHSGLSVASTGLQSDLMPDGGGRTRILRKKESEKKEMQEIVQNEIRSAMVGQQVLFLAQMFQSAMMQASNFLNQTQNIPPTSTTKVANETMIRSEMQPPPAPQKSDGKLQILSLAEEKSYILPSSKFSQKPRRAPLTLLTENQTFKKSQTQYLHDENANAPVLLSPSKSQRKAPVTVPPTYTGPKEAFVEKPAKEERRPDQNSMMREAGASTLTPEMLHDTKLHGKGACPTCHSHPGPKTAVRLPLLSLADAISAKSGTHQPGMVDAFPRLINMRQVLRYQQKRMAESGQQSQSIMHVGKALPLLDAEKVLGFYRQKPQFREIPFVIPRAKQSTQQSKPVKVQPAKSEPEVVVSEPLPDESRVEIPKELLPTVLTEEEAHQIRNGVLSHYKAIVDQQKLMWREAGQQTDVLEEETQDRGVGPSPEHERLFQAIPRHTERPRTDRYEMHEEFLDRFLDVNKDRVPNQDGLPSKDLKAQDVTQMQGPEADMKVPAVQKLVKSRWSSAMNQMSSEIDAVTELDRNLRYRVPYESEAVAKSVSRPSSAVSSEIRPQIHKRYSPASSHSDKRSPRSVRRPTTPTYLPPSELISAIGNRFPQERSNDGAELRMESYSRLDELAKYRRKIDEAFSLADFGPQRELSDHSLVSSRQITPASSMHKLDGSAISSLSWDELEAMMTESILADAEGEHGSIGNISNVDARIQDAMQILNDLQSEQGSLNKKVSRNTKKQPQMPSKRFKKREADVDARIDDAMSLLKEIKTDQKQLKTGGKPVGAKGTLNKSSGRSSGVDNWTLEAMSLLKELKSEYEPEYRAERKENLPPEVFGKTDSKNMRSHIEEAMALLRDDESASPVSFQPSSHVSFQPTSQMPRRYY